MSSFALNYYFTGFHPFYFKATNLAIHMANGVGIFALTKLLLEFYRKRFTPGLTSNFIQWASLAVCATWLLHPFNLTGVLFAVQRMTSLSTFFCIWGLVVFFVGRTRLYEGKSGLHLVLISILIFTPLAALSKETGALLPLFMFVAELSLFKFEAQQTSARRLLGILFFAVIALPAIAVSVKLLFHPEIIINPYKNRDFTLSERLMTEARVMWFYMKQIILPNISEMGLFHDDIPNSHGLLQPVSTLLSIIGLTALSGVALISRKKAPLLCFGILFFFAGHVLESTIFPLEITFEHRNYLPMYGLLLALQYYLLHPLKHIDTLKIRKIFSVMLIILYAGCTYARAGHWANPMDQAIYDVETHPNSARYNGHMGAIYGNWKTADPQVMESNYQLARQFYDKATAVDPNYTESLFAIIILSSERDKPVEEAWVAELKRRLRYALLPNNAGNQLDRLFRCQMSGICKPDSVRLGELLQAALDNPSLSGSNVSIVLTVQAHYLINVIKDYPQALKMMYKAIDASPELDYRVSLIRVLVALGHDAEAREQLQILQRLDKLHLYDAEIAKQSELIADHAKK